MVYLYALASIVLGAVAQLLLKMAMSQPSSGQSFPCGLQGLLLSGKMITGMACYAVSMVFWLYVLSKLDLSKAYPMVALGYVLASIFGWLFLGEPVKTTRIVGLMVIVVGVIIISRS